MGQGVGAGKSNIAGNQGGKTPKMRFEAEITVPNTAR
jgi:hypothetical protein